MPMPISSSPLIPFCYSTNYHGYSRNSKKLRLLTFSFKNKFNKKYIIKVEEFDKKIFILKFFLKTHTMSDNRFNVLTGERDAFRIFSTCLNVLYYIKSEVETEASFGFIGARALGKEDNDENTQRFRIYSTKGKTFFNPDNYIHVQNIKNSTYLILDRRLHTEESVFDIQKMFEELFRINH
jgi:hypothetical protein